MGNTSYDRPDEYGEAVGSVDGLQAAREECDPMLAEGRGEEARGEARGAVTMHATSARTVSTESGAEKKLRTPREWRQVRVCSSAERDSYMVHGIH